MSIKALPFTALCAALCSILSSAHAVTITVPDNLQTPPTLKLAVEANAVGVQIYACTAVKADGGKTSWVFKAPEATLYDGAGTKLARHYAGPTWEATDGSKVVGKVKASATPTDNAVAWLLLDVKSTQGPGTFSKVKAVQRLATEAGKAPADGCDKAAIGHEVRVPYKAVYRFFIKA